MGNWQWAMGKRQNARGKRQWAIGSGQRALCKATSDFRPPTSAPRPPPSDFGLPPLSQFINYGRALPDADAHCREPIFFLASFHFMDQRGRNSYYTASQWMTDSNCTTIGVDFVLVQPKVVDTGDGL